MDSVNGSSIFSWRYCFTAYGHTVTIEKSKPQISNATEIMRGYTLKDSTIDMGNLFFAACEFHAAMAIAVAKLNEAKWALAYYADSDKEIIVHDYVGEYPNGGYLPVHEGGDRAKQMIKEIDEFMKMFTE